MNRNIESNDPSPVGKPLPDDGARSVMEHWGWNASYQATADAIIAASDETGDLVAARVVRHVHHTYHVVAAPTATMHSTEVSGAFSYRAVSPADYPTVGDWVLLESPGGRINHVLPRRTAVCRSVAGRESLPQVIAANVDILLLVFGLDGGRNFTAGLLERSLLVAWNSGARPIIVLNKTDCADRDWIETVSADARAQAPHESIHLASAVTGDGIEALLGEIPPATTVAMLGKSGVGKSALINAFVRASAGSGPTSGPGPAREGHLRAGDRQGRHTTTEKQLYRLPSGQLIIDVPGLRELQLWADVADLDSTFPEIDALAAGCRFRDCAHQGEPGCRVVQALATGELPADRYERYLEYRRELAYLHRRRDARAEANEREKWKQIAKRSREFKKERPHRGGG